MGSTARFLMLLSSPSFPLLHHRSSVLLRLSRRPNHHHLPLPLLYSPPRPLGPTTNTKSAPLFLLPIKPSHHLDRRLHTQSASTNFADSYSTAQLPRHPWQEFSAFLDNLAADGYFNSNPHFNPDEFVEASSFTEEFLRASSACLAFAHHKANIFGLLSRREIGVLVQNGNPFLFKNGDESARRMRAFLECGQSNVSQTDEANMVDLMRFLLSYAGNVVASPESNNVYDRELVESSVRNLLGELAKHTSKTQYQERYVQRPTSFRQNIEMKKGDWICPRCNFMNFARNMKCLECEEARPKRQLTGGEWECPQCAFFNYGRNTVCLRCDCKRPVDVSIGSSNYRPNLAYGTDSTANKADLESRLAANEEKAQRWFSKISQLDSASDMSAIADEDFPEIMPLRKGVNRFVVSTRKTPLERRLANAQYRRNMSIDGTPADNNMQNDGAKRTLDTKDSRSLDETLGLSSTASGSNDNNINVGQSSGIADMFAKKPENSKIEENQTAVSVNNPSVASNAGDLTSAAPRNYEHRNFGDSQQLAEKPANQKESGDIEKGQAEKSQSWFKRVTELHNVTDLESAISDEDYPETMPMRKGENRFVVSRKKDRSLTSPLYKRKMAMEQASDTNYVPFVPFPPDYFAKKDGQQPEGTDTTAKSAAEVPAPGTSDKNPDKSWVESQQTERWNLTPGENLNETRNGATYGAQTNGSSTENVTNPQTSSNDGWSSGFSGNETKKETTNLTGSSTQQSEVQNIRNSWTGKSLEGSAVKEPDPLDMSEEAKAERWFRRVAQIKDISELSQIPDEDFPSIMPMRKGVNRFVVSKRKTPLERRLTSQRYRRNLPIVSTDPLDKESESSN